MLAEVFTQAAVYADRLDLPTRAALHIDDLLVEEVAQALAAGRWVVLCGNAGDGKSHLAQMALDRLRSRAVVEVARGVPAAPLGPGDVVFVRDASGVSGSELLRTAKRAQAANATLLVTANHGPLAAVAAKRGGERFAEVAD